MKFHSSPQKAAQSTARNAGQNADRQEDDNKLSSARNFYRVRYNHKKNHIQFTYQSRAKYYFNSLGILVSNSFINPLISFIAREIKIYELIKLIFRKLIHSENARNSFARKMEEILVIGEKERNLRIKS